MSCAHGEIRIKSESRPTFHDVTEDAVNFIKGSRITDGLLTVYSQHTTCSVFVQEQSDDTNYYGTQYILQDLVNGLSRIFPTCETEGQYLHPGPLHISIAKQERNEEACWSLNTDAHLRSVMLGRSVQIPVQNGELILGEFGRIYFADFDQVRARERIVRFTVIG